MLTWPGTRTSGWLGPITKVGALEVYFQAFAADGSPLWAMERATTTAAELIPAIEPWDNGVVVAWNEVRLGAVVCTVRRLVP